MWSDSAERTLGRYLTYLASYIATLERANCKYLQRWKRSRKLDSYVPTYVPKAGSFKVKKMLIFSRTLLKITHRLRLWIASETKMEMHTTWLAFVKQPSVFVWISRILNLLFVLRGLKEAFVWIISVCLPTENRYCLISWAKEKKTRLINNMASNRNSFLRCLREKWTRHQF